MPGSLTFPRSAAFGPVINVLVGPDLVLRDAYSQQSTAPPSPKPIKLLVDTGADRTTIHRRFFDGWSLAGVTWVQVQTNNGVSTRQRSKVSLAIQDPSGQSILEIDPLEVTMSDSEAFDDTPYIGLLGRDVLDRGSLVYDAVCTLTF